MRLAMWSAQAKLLRSEFVLPLLRLDPPRARAMRNLYIFCRIVDDIADGPQPQAVKRAALDRWDDEITQLYAGRPEHPAARALAAPVAAYRLPRDCFHELLAGMRMDVDQVMRHPDAATLDRYCHRVASCVGLLSVRVFGCVRSESEAYALALGQAMQRTNILRDVLEDAAMERLYLPAEWLRETGLGAMTPADVPRRLDALKPVLMRLAAQAESYYDEAERLVQPEDRKALATARRMAAGYRRLLAMMQADGWRYGRRYRLSLREKMVCCFA